METVVRSERQREPRKLGSGASKDETNITPESLTEIRLRARVGNAGILPLQRTHMLVCRRRCEAALLMFGIIRPLPS